MDLLIYNPDTDYALASGSPFYTLPASVKRLISASTYMAAAWGKHKDLILLPDWIEPESFDARYYAENRSFTIMTDSRLKDSPNVLNGLTAIKPWGWNPSLKHRLHAAGVPDHLLPTDEQIANIRELSHRRLTIKFNKELDQSALPVVINSEDEGIEFWKQNPGCWFKAPWSSSGRGVICTAELQESHIRPWIRGMIRRQGCVMAESGADKSIDFASEWEIIDKEPIFLGLSYFEISGRGKYHGNHYMPQDQIFAIINSHSNSEIMEVIDSQKSAIRKLISPYYEGPLGIDMLVEKSGVIRPCIELNIRRTMGHVALYNYENHTSR